MLLTVHLESGAAAVAAAAPGAKLSISETIDRSNVLYVLSTRGLGNSRVKCAKVRLQNWLSQKWLAKVIHGKMTRDIRPGSPVALIAFAFKGRGAHHYN